MVLNFLNIETIYKISPILNKSELMLDAVENNPGLDGVVNSKNE